MSTRVPFDEAGFRRALGAFATGVTVITTRDAAGRAVGLTVNSFNSVSLAPPLVLWSIARRSRSYAAFAEATHWAVHVLAVDQEALARRFSRGRPVSAAGVEGVPPTEAAVAAARPGAATGDGAVVTGAGDDAEDRFASLDFETGRHGLPLLSGCAARFECRAAAQHEGGDHLILIGEVEALVESGAAPLVYLRGRYAQASELGASPSRLPS